jgi:hypothetical protein
VPRLHPPIGQASQHLLPPPALLHSFPKLDLTFTPCTDSRDGPHGCTFKSCIFQQSKEWGNGNTRLLFYFQILQEWEQFLDVKSKA